MKVLAVAPCFDEALGYSFKVKSVRKAWNKGLTKDTDVRVKKIAEKLKQKAERGETFGFINNPEVKHHPHTEEAKEKMRKRKQELIASGWQPWNKGKGEYLSPEARRRVADAHRGKVPWNKGRKKLKKCLFCGKVFANVGRKYCSRKCRDEARKVRVERECIYCHKKFTVRPSGRKLFCSTKCRNLWLFKCKVNKKPTKLELIIKRLIQKNNLPFRYVGNYSLWVGYMNPDFIHTRDKKVIEVFGDYWHNSEDAKKRIESFAKYGYRCLIIWEHEPKDEEKVVKKLLEFGGDKECECLV
jgi:G:T-mismatch repair DNA endonuclease (very short patch repair protein)